MIGHKPKRFWSNATVEIHDEGYGISLDGRSVRTPAKALLAVPTRALALELAEEWASQGEIISAESMPLTRAANSTIDKVVPQFAAIASMIAEYAATDLLCYRADAPVALTERQALAWDPWLDWSAEEYGARLFTVVGVMHHPQPEKSLSLLRAAVLDLGPFALTGIHDLVTLSGSLILGLAVARAATDAETAWDLSRTDETWQEEHWGRDEEAARLTAAKRTDFLRAAHWISLLEGLDK